MYKPNFDTWDEGTNGGYGGIIIGTVLDNKPSLEEKLDALMEHLGLEFKNVPEKLEVKKCPTK